jgi:hypothetical protein
LAFLVIPIPFPSLLENKFLNPIFNRPFNLRQLIDRPLFEMAVFLPLTILLSIGIVEWLRARSSRVSVVSLEYAKTIAIIALVIIGLINFPLTPTCCQILSLEDLFAIEWMKNELPETSTILISGAYSATHRHFQTTDAGIWIQPLTKLKTANGSYDHTFDNRSFQYLCKRMVTHIYAGSDSYSFSKPQLQSSTNYVEMYSLGKVSIFGVICPYPRE